MCSHIQCLPWEPAATCLGVDSALYACLAAPQVQNCVREEFAQFFVLVEECLPTFLTAEPLAEWAPKVGNGIH